MASFNKVVLLGNVTRDPQIRHTTGGTAMCDLGLAINREWFDKQSNTKKSDVTFVDVQCWGRTAEVASEYCSKGKQVMIEGRLQLDQWDDRDTGQKRSKLKVVCESLVLLGSKADGGGSRSSPQQSDNSSSSGGESSDFGGSPSNDDDVPF